MAGLTAKGGRALPKRPSFSKDALAACLALTVLGSLGSLPACADPYEVKGVSEADLLKHIDLHHKPDNSSHVFLWWIDHDGKKVKRLNYEAVDVMHGGVAAAVRGPSYSSVLIGIDGDSIGKEEFTGLGNYSEGLIPAQVDLNWGFVDRDGDSVIKPQFNSVEEFSEGLAPACSDKLFGYIDRLGNYAIQPKFEKAESFHENLAAAKYKGKWGYIDKDGSFIIQPQFDQASKFADERAVVQMGEKWGVIDQRGKFCVEPKYLDAGFYREGVCPVKDGEKWGFIDRSGTLVIPAVLDRAFPFHEGNAAVRIGTRFGYIDHDNKLEIPAQYDLALPFAEGVAVVGEINWNHPSTRVFLMMRHLENMQWRKDDDKATSLDGYYVPQNQADAVKELMAILPKDAIEDMKIIDRDEMSSYQYSLGEQMRRNWGLFKCSRLGKSFGAKNVNQPEEMTALILNEVWEKLHGAAAN